VALLALALREPDSVVVTDDRPLRKACKAVLVSVSGSIGVLVRSVETGELSADEATKRLYAIDETSARLSASLVKRAEKLIDDAGD
jgi:predicted nucleic acid-binding protein